MLCRIEEYWLCDEDKEERVDESWAELEVGAVMLIWLWEDGRADIDIEPLDTKLLSNSIEETLEAIEVGIAELKDCVGLSKSEEYLL